MANFLLCAIRASVALLLFGLGAGILPASAQSPDVWVPLAKGMAVLGGRSEQAGKFDEALNYYRSVIGAAEAALKNTPASNSGSGRESYILLASGHIDSARVLLIKAAIPALRQPDGSPQLADLLNRLDIIQHTKSAEDALLKAEALQQQSSEECARKNRGKQIQEIAFCINYSDIINAELGDLSLLKGDPVRARQYFAAALRQRPDSAHAKAALVHIDEAARVEDGGSAYAQKVRIWAVQVLGADLTRKVAVVLIKDLVGRLNSLAGSVSGVVADSIIERAQSRLKSN